MGVGVGIHTYIGLYNRVGFGVGVGIYIHTYIGLYNRVGFRVGSGYIHTYIGLFIIEILPSSLHMRAISEEKLFLSDYVWIATFFKVSCQIQPQGLSGQCSS